VLLPDREYHDELRNRLLAEGITVEQHASGQESLSLRQRGAALEAAWEAAVRVAAIERHRLLAVATEVSRWRRPWRPFVITATVLVVFTTLLAAMLGGVIPSPAWFQPITDWFWSLPWP
jgi:hypothetical protein